AAIGDQAFRVGCVRKVTEAEIVSHMYTHLGLVTEGAELTIIPSVLPPPESGKFSTRNIQGREIVRKDLPKIPKEIFMGDRPKYGDWNNGSFPLWITKMVYQRELETPRNLRIRIRQIGA